MTLSTLISVISLLFGSGVLATVIRLLHTRIRENDKKTEALCLGVQALLRDRMIAMYEKYDEKEYAPIYAKKNFENMWVPYHTLGANGVMDDMREKFKDLPERKQEV